MALRRDARALQHAVAALLPPEESLGSNTGSGFRATLRPEFAPLQDALDLLTLESPADARSRHLAQSGVARADLEAVLRRRRDFERVAINKALDDATLAEGEGLCRFKWRAPGEDED